MFPPWPEEDWAALERAVQALERPSLAARVTTLLGLPVSAGLRRLPPGWQTLLAGASERAITAAVAAAVRTLGEEPPRGEHDRLHRYAAVATGAVGGFFGLPALVVELPVTTTLMLRAIADTAARHGEDPRELKTRLACVEVFALGGRTRADDDAELGYYELRAALALQLRALPLDALARGAGRAVPGAEAFVRAIAGRFGVVVSDKVAAQAVPILGAAAGAALNGIFMRHFQTVAEGHFSLRALERRHGREAVEAAYRALAAREQEGA